MGLSTSTIQHFIILFKDESVSPIVQAKRERKTGLARVNA